MCVCVCVLQKKKANWKEGKTSKRKGVAMDILSAAAYRLLSAGHGIQNHDDPAIWRMKSWKKRKTK